MRAGGPTGRLADYPDGWSAMAVREWRQGLRARTFVVPFLVLQAGLTLFGLIQLDARNSEGVARGFWFLLLVLLSLVLPLRNLGALADERDGNTMDMLLLTNMGAWRMVTGKWLATAGMLGLTAVSAVPAVVLRSVAAGWPLGKSLAGLVAGLAMACGLAAVLTAVSWLRITLVRTGVAMFFCLVVLVQGVLPLTGALAEGRVGAMGFSGQVMGLVLVSVAAGWAGLVLAASPVPDRGVEKWPLRLALRMGVALAVVGGLLRFTGIPDVVGEAMLGCGAGLLLAGGVRWLVRRRGIRG